MLDWIYSSSCIHNVIFFLRQDFKKWFYSLLKEWRIFTLMLQQQLFTVCGLLSKKIENMHFWCYHDLWIKKKKKSCGEEQRRAKPGREELSGYYQAASQRRNPDHQWTVLKQSFGSLWWPFFRITHFPRYGIVVTLKTSLLFGKWKMQWNCLSIQTLGCMSRLGELAKDFRST